MSRTIIEDGTGGSYKTKVTEGNRFCTDTVSRNQLEYACLSGNGYNISTGSITLTTAGTSAVAFFKYTGNDIAIVKELIVILGESTSGTGAGTITLTKNSTDGTIESTATVADIIANRDFSSAKTIDGLIYKGTEGATVVGGTVFATTTRTNFSQPVTFDAAPMILRKGNTVVVTYTPPAGNTSQNVIVAGTIYIETINIK